MQDQPTIDVEQLRSTEDPLALLRDVLAGRSKMVAEDYIRLVRLINHRDGNLTTATRS